MELFFKKLDPSAETPSKACEWDAGYDLYSRESLSIAPMERRVVSLGISVEIPRGFYGRIAPRSGLAINKGVDVLGGVVDSGYRGELKVILINLNLPEQLFLKNNKQAMTYSSLFGSKHRFDISAGDRVAQLIIEKCHYISWKEQENLSESDRQGGFGSAGI